MHWYTKDGAPYYEHEGKPIGLKLARELSLLPGVTSIISCAHNPGLESWKIRTAIETAVRASTEGYEGEGEFIDAMVAKSNEVASSAALRGSAIHSAIEDWLLTGNKGPFPEIIEAVSNILKDYPGIISEQSFATADYGGKVDLHLPNLVIDIKTKDILTANNKKLYDSHYMQLAAYAHGLGMSDYKAGILWVDTQGEAKLSWASEKKLKQGWGMFKALLRYWQVKNRFV